MHYNGTYMQIHAGAAKAAVDAMTKHMAVELVNIILFDYIKN